MDNFNKHINAKINLMISKITDKYKNPFRIFLSKEIKNNITSIALNNSKEESMKIYSNRIGYAFDISVDINKIVANELNKDIENINLNNPSNEILIKVMAMFMSIYFGYGSEKYSSYNKKIMKISSDIVVNEVMEINDGHTAKKFGLPEGLSMIDYYRILEILMNIPPENETDEDSNDKEDTDNSDSNDNNQNDNNNEIDEDDSKNSDNNQNKNNEDGNLNDAETSKESSLNESKDEDSYGDKSNRGQNEIKDTSDKTETENEYLRSIIKALNDEKEFPEIDVDESFYNDMKKKYNKNEITDAFKSIQFSNISKTQKYIKLNKSLDIIINDIMKEEMSINKVYNGSERTWYKINNRRSKSNLITPGHIKIDFGVSESIDTSPIVFIDKSRSTISFSDGMNYLAYRLLNEAGATIVTYSTSILSVYVPGSGSIISDKATGGTDINLVLEQFNNMNIYGKLENRKIYVVTDGADNLTRPIKEYGAKFWVLDPYSGNFIKKIKRIKDLEDLEVVL